MFVFSSVGHCGGEHGGQSGGVQGGDRSDRLHVQITRRLWRDHRSVVLCELSHKQTYGGRCVVSTKFIVFVLYQSLKVRPLHGRQRMYYQDAFRQDIDQGTPFSDRISVNISVDTGVAMLTINEVRLQDELEYICVIKALMGEEGQGSTKLKVFGKKAYPLTVIRSSFSKPVEERHIKNGENTR